MTVMPQLKVNDVIIVTHSMFMEQFSLALVTKVTPKMVGLLTYNLRKTDWNEEVQVRAKNCFVKLIGERASKAEIEWLDVAMQMDTMYKAKEAAVKAAKQTFMDGMRALG